MKYFKYGCRDSPTGSCAFDDGSCQYCGRLNRQGALKKYWSDVRAGRREPPQRDKSKVSRTLSIALDGTFGPDRGKRLVITVRMDGRIEIRPERTTRTETIHVLDLYRYAIRCRVNQVVLARARDRKAKKAERLAKARQERAEKRLFS